MGCRPRESGSRENRETDQACSPAIDNGAIGRGSTRMPIPIRLYRIPLPSWRIGPIHRLKHAQMEISYADYIVHQVTEPAFKKPRNILMLQGGWLGIFEHIRSAPILMILQCYTKPYTPVVCHFNQPSFVSRLSFHRLKLSNSFLILNGLLSDRFALLLPAKNMQRNLKHFALEHDLKTVMISPVCSSP